MRCRDGSSVAEVLRRREFIKEAFMKIKWKTIAPLVVWLVIYLLPIPSGLNANQWHYFAVFAAVITGLVLESMPVGAVGLIGLTFAAVMGLRRIRSQQIAPLGAQWIRGEHRLADRRGVRVRDRLSQEWTGQSHRSTAGTGLGPSNTRLGLCRDIRRPDSGSGHAVEHRAQWWHDLSDRQQFRRSMAPSLDPPRGRLAPM